MMRRLAPAFTAVTLAALALPATGSAKAAHLHAHLKGATEVPGPGDPDGRGMAELRLNAKRGKVCYEIRTRKIDGASAAHIHAGKKGVAGDVVVALFAGSGGRKLEGCVRDVAKSTIRAIVRNPKRYYVNVHNSGYPNGAVRGQLNPHE
jgi:hypothetical protein